MIGKGAKLAIWDVSDSLNVTAGDLDQPYFEKLETALEAEFKAAMDRSIAALSGKLDILVSSAGVTGPNFVLRDYPADDWR